MSLNHLDQSNHNKDTSDFLNTQNPNYIDWEITTLFYAALHRVDNYFKNNGPRIPTDHQERNRLVRQELPTVVYSAYHKLFVLSLRARYSVGLNMQEPERGLAVNSYAVLTTNLP